MTLTHWYTHTTHVESLVVCVCVCVHACVRVAVKRLRDVQ